jgi:hypothetical protein
MSQKLRMTGKLIAGLLEIFLINWSCYHGIDSACLAHRCAFDDISRGGFAADLGAYACADIAGWNINDTAAGQLLPGFQCLKADSLKLKRQAKIRRTRPQDFPSAEKRHPANLQEDIVLSGAQRYFRSDSRWISSGDSKLRQDIL